MIVTVETAPASQVEEALRSIFNGEWQDLHVYVDRNVDGENNPRMASGIDLESWVTVGMVLEQYSLASLR